MFSWWGEESSAFPEVLSLIPGDEEEDGSVEDSDRCDVDFVEPARCEDEFER